MKRVSISRDQAAQEADRQQVKYYQAAASAASAAKDRDLATAIEVAKKNYDNENDTELKALAKAAYVKLLQAASK